MFWQQQPIHIYVTIILHFTPKQSSMNSDTIQTYMSTDFVSPLKASFRELGQKLRLT